MIILCPKALASLFSIDNNSNLEKEFLKRMLSKCVGKAIIPDEVWEAFRFRMKRDSSDANNVEKTIALCRSMVSPEFEKLDEDYQEIEPTKDYNNQELIDKTKDLIQRRYAEIDILITTEPANFQNLPNAGAIKILTIDGYYMYHITDMRRRHWIEEYLGEIERQKWE